MAHQRSPDSRTTSVSAAGKKGVEGQAAFLLVSAEQVEQAANPERESLLSAAALT